MIRPDYLKRAELTLAILLSAASLFLLAVRALHAGPLWRDECAVVNLARMPALSDIARNFQHEAFPVPFPVLIRAYTGVLGTSDFALRTFGIAVGLAVLCALWINARLVGKNVPLLSMALLGLNATFLVWGTTVRGYGLGSALIILTFGLVVRAIQSPTPGWIALSGAAALAAVQCLVHNLALVFVITFAAVLVGVIQKNAKIVIAFLSTFTICLISFLPCLNAYSGSDWSEVVKFPVTFRLLWNQFNFALGNPTPAWACLWYIIFAIFVGASFGTLVVSRRNKSSPEWGILLMGCLVSIGALIVYYEFLNLLSYLARSWYYLALLSILAVSLDALAMNLGTASWIRLSRLAFGLVALVFLPVNAWPKVIERQTNIDIVAEKVTELARPTDLIVVAPWQYGISFPRYYHGSNPWITLPTISDLRLHRYDLFREKMFAAHPIDDVLEKIQQTLSGGNRVWIVGGIRLPPTGQSTWSFPPAGENAFGRDNVAYSEAWMQQMSVFVREHSESGQNIPLPARAVNQYEEVPLLVIEGWH